MNKNLAESILMGAELHPSRSSQKQYKVLSVGTKILRPQPTYSPSVVQQPFSRTVGISARVTSISFKQPRT